MFWSKATEKWRSDLVINLFFYRHIRLNKQDYILQVKPIILQVKPIILQVLVVFCLKPIYVQLHKHEHDQSLF